MLNSDLSLVEYFRALRHVNSICEKGPIQFQSFFYINTVQPKNNPSDDLILKILKKLSMVDKILAKMAKK